MNLFRGQRGFTLIETIVSIVVIGIALAGLAAVFGLGFARGADPLRERQALAIAEAYLEEALLQPYADPDPPGSVCAAPEANRAIFDDACDYNALANNGCITVTAACPLGACACGQNGVPINALAGFAITMTVTTDTTTTLGPPNVNALRVVVSVTTPGGITPLQLVGFKAQP